ncbi:uncharacterized protein LOC108736993 [Agrilus planipennis]|uniref:Uncharacterized protein LOC108736993 n=1 Tax=Agrilus planipennis TaxID=224129 RepID=A0A1W4WYA2_AGRPL|nr:uncharacterized protein LOC108736993 [Agrilus planipennis]
MAEKGKKPLLPSDYVWEQNIDSLIIFIKLKDIEYPLIKIEKNKVYLKCVAEKDRKLYEMDINLYEEINIGNSIYNIQSDGIRFFLKKQILCLWPYLTQDHKDKINASGGHIMEYFLKKSQKNYVQDVVGVVDTDEQTPKEQGSAFF